MNPLVHTDKSPPLPTDRIEYDPVAVKADWRDAIERHKRMQNERDERLARYAREAKCPSNG